MNEATVKEKLAELTDVLKSLPTHGSVSKLSEEGIYQASHHSSENIGLDDIVDMLRLQIRYLLFDLEATRRENRYLRQMLERRPPLNDGPDKGDLGK